MRVNTTGKASSVLRRCHGAENAMRESSARGWSRGRWPR